MQHQRCSYVLPNKIYISIFATSRTLYFAGSLLGQVSGFFFSWALFLEGGWIVTTLEPQIQYCWLTVNPNTIINSKRSFKLPNSLAWSLKVPTPHHWIIRSLVPLSFSFLFLVQIIPPTQPIGWFSELEPRIIRSCFLINFI